MLNNDSRPCFLVIRPTDRWEATRIAFAPLDIDLSFTDVLTYTATNEPVPDLTEVNAVIVTSLRAVQSLQHIPAVLNKLPFYVVGIETARALKVMGLTGPQTVAPTARALVELLNGEAHKTLLYIRGDEVALDFRQELIGHTVTPYVTYTSSPKEGLDLDTITRIKTGRINGVMFFSRKSAEAFVTFAKGEGLIAHFPDLIALCLSRAVLECIHTLSWARTKAAITPDLVGMVGAVRALAQPDIQDPVIQDLGVQEEEHVMSHAGTPYTPSNNDQLLDADTIIERFGGIRPMATKIGVPVTTVQGWKKRGVIPANRAHLIEAAAQTHGLEIKGLVRIVTGDDVTNITLPRAQPKAQAAVASEPAMPQVPKFEVKGMSLPPIEGFDDEDDVSDHVSTQSDEAQESQSISDVLSEIAAIVSAPMDEGPTGPLIDEVADEVVAVDNQSAATGSAPTSVEPVQPATNVTTAGYNGPDRRTGRGPKPEFYVPKRATDISGAWPHMNRRGSDKIARATWWSVILLALAVVFGLVVLAPRLEHMRTQDQRLAALQTDVQRLVDEVDRLRSEKMLMEAAVPDDLKTQLADIQSQARTMETTVANLDTQSKALTAGVMGDKAGTIEQRLSTIEDQMRASKGAGAVVEPLTVFLGRLQVLYAAPDGQKMVDSALDDLARLAGAAKDVPAFQDAVSSGLSDGVSSSPLNQVLGDMRGNDALSAVKILALTSFRRAVAVDHRPFIRELVILRAAGADKATLIDPLMGIARTGIATDNDLVKSFDKVADEITAASLASSNLSLVDRVQAQLHTVLKIERNGKSWTGTQTQRTVDDAKRKLAAGDVAGAANVLQALDGEAAVKAAAWASEAEQALTTLRIQDLLTKTIVADISVNPLIRAQAGLPSGTIDVQNLTRGVVEGLSSPPARVGSATR